MAWKERLAVYQMLHYIRALESLEPDRGAQGRPLFANKVGKWRSNRVEGVLFASELDSFVQLKVDIRQEHHGSWEECLWGPKCGVWWYNGGVSLVGESCLGLLTHLFILLTLLSFEVFVVKHAIQATDFKPNY